jgi:disulfide bond formation protein DsbB
MYSTFAIALIGTIIKDEADTYKYLLGLALPGFLIAIYHYFIQKLPNNPYVYGCSIGNPCTRIDFELFGFITIPLMSAVCFALILILIVIKLKVDRES